MAKIKINGNNALGCDSDLHASIIKPSSWATASAMPKPDSSEEGECTERREYILSSLSSHDRRIITGWTDWLAAPAGVIMQQSTQV